MSTQQRADTRSKKKKKKGEEKEKKENIRVPTAEAEASGTAKGNGTGSHSLSNVTETDDPASTVERNAQGETGEVGNAIVITEAAERDKPLGSAALNDEPAAGPSQSDTVTENDEPRTDTSPISVWNFTCLLFNLGRSTSKYVPLEPRQNLLQRIFDKQQDVMFLQETENYQPILKKLESNYYHERFVPQSKQFTVAVLFKQSTFESVDNITPSVLQRLQDSHIKSLYTQMKADGDMRMCICKAVPLGRKTTLF